jgi:group I intron endonuclease
MFYVYIISNIVNGKLYVGKTQNVHSRFRDHLKIARGGKEKYHESYSYIHAALNKYGPDNFLIRTVESDLDEITAFLKEKEWISHLKDDGYTLYNLTEGGDGPSGRKATDEQRKKQSERQMGTIPWNKGKQTPEDVRAKQSVSAQNRFKREIHPLKGKPSPLKGTKRPDEFGKKISASKKGVPRSKEHILATSKLTEEQVREIKSLIRAGVPNNEIAEKYHVYRDTISRIKNNKTWAWVK